MYFIVENHINPNGTVNTETVARQTFASALSFYHERYSKMVMTELYPKVAIMLCDADLNVVQHDIIDTQYKADEDTKVEYVVDGEVVGFQ